MIAPCAQCSVCLHKYDKKIPGGLLASDTYDKTPSASIDGDGVANWKKHVFYSDEKKKKSQLLNLLTLSIKSFSECLCFF